MKAIIYGSPYSKIVELHMQTPASTPLYCRSRREAISLVTFYSLITMSPIWIKYETLPF